MKTLINRLFIATLTPTASMSFLKMIKVTTPPDVLTVVLVTPTNGGGIITYDLPNDNDVLYVRAVYTNTNGVEVSRASSSYNNHIEVSGFESNDSSNNYTLCSG